MIDLWSEAEELEWELGDPSVPSNLLSRAAVVSLDEEERFPHDQCRRIQRLGYTRFCSPSQWLGGNCSFDQLLGSSRAVARRDLTTAIALGQTLLGSIPVLLAGNADQSSQLDLLIDTGSLGCLALTEETHGSDLAATEMLATANEAGYLINGTKWLINNCTLSGFISLLAQVGSRGEGSTSRGLTLFLVDKSQLRQGEQSYLPKIKTHGIRGADISGISFHDSFVAKSTVLGRLGDGFPLVSKTLQVSRTLCAGLSLGAADNALRYALEFAVTRRLYNSALLSIDSVSRLCVQSFIKLITCESLALLACRGISFCPEQMPVWSAVTKFLVPTQIDSMICDCALVLGARHYLRDNEPYGIFQKVMRDNQVVSLFDGNTAVNLNIIASHLPALAISRINTSGPSGPGVKESLERVARLDQEYRPDRFPTAHALRVISSDDMLVASLRSIPSLLGNIARPVVSELRPLVKELMLWRGNIDREVLSIRDDRRFDSRSAAAFSLAKQYCSIHAAVACLLLWIYNQEKGDSFFASGEWLILALASLICPERQLEGYYARHGRKLLERLIELHRRRMLFSLFPFELPESETLERPGNRKTA